MDGLDLDTHAAAIDRDGYTIVRDFLAPEDLADGDALPVQHLRDVVRVGSFDLEGDDSRTPVRRRAEDAHAFERLQLRERVVEEVALVTLDRLKPDLAEIVDRRAEPDRLRDRSGAGLELVREFVPRRARRAPRGRRFRSARTSCDL